MKNRLFITLLAAFCAGLFLSARAQETRKIYLSGTGFGNTVKWDFYCTEGQRQMEKNRSPFAMGVAGIR